MERVLNPSSDLAACEPALSNIDRRRSLPGASQRVEEAICDAVSAARVRRFEPRHVAQVTDLFVETFRARAQANRRAIARCIEETYLACVASPDEAHSLVHVEEDGAVTGFVGMLPTAMQMNGRSLKVGILGAFMVSHPAQNPAVAVRLGRAVRAAPLDLVTSDTTNPRSLFFYRALRFDLLPTHSLEWVKALRPAEAFARLATRRLAATTPLAARLGKFAEPLARRIYDSSLGEQATPSSATNLIDVPGFLERAESLSREWLLRPEWRSPAVRWLISQAALKVRNGPMRLCEVVDRNGRLRGAYILYLARGKIAHALQILARPNCEREVVASLLRQADGEGATAVRGVVDPSVLTGLAGIPGVYYHQGAAAIAFSRDPEIRAALKEGKALIGGLIGERWNRLVADPFA